uniref:Uncharacterized protein n=1 Tax=Oreochromis aureus TaxID=47969 RepID=A0AAZ1WVH9_OREAU
MDENTLTPLRPWTYFFPGSDFAKWNNRVVSNLGVCNQIKFQIKIVGGEFWIQFCSEQPVCIICCSQLSLLTKYT